MIQDKSIKAQLILKRIKPHGIYSFSYLCILSIVLLIIFVYSYGIYTPIIFEGDLHISYPKSKETISSSVLFIGFCIFPVVLITILSYFLYQKVGPKLHVYFRFMVTYILCIAYTVVITLIFVSVLKNIFVVPRPDFFSRCGYPLSESGLYGTPGHIANLSLCSCLYSSSFPCSSHELADMYFSFPSGHSATAGCLFMNLILIIRFLIQDTHINIRFKYFLYSLVYIFGLLGAFSIGATRAYDHRHSPVDISVGLALGLIIAYVVFQFFFKLHSKTHEPYTDKYLFCLNDSSLSISTDATVNSVTEQYNEDSQSGTV